MSMFVFRLIVPLLALLLGLAPLSATAGGPAAGPRDRCPVCGMFVAPYPNWLSLATFADGETLFFDGPKDLFRFLADVPAYRPGRDRADLAQVMVTEYYSTRLVAATEVFFVAGSDVLGPMGAELVPIAGKQHAEAFLRDHGGDKIMIFDGNDIVEASSAAR